jgi:hypothetical protein
MNDLDLMVAGAMVMFIAFAGAYVAMHHHASEATVDNHEPGEPDSQSTSSRQSADSR